LSGEWVAVDNINVSMDNKGELRFMSDVIFHIAEIQKTGKYSVTMNPKGSRLYSVGLIEKTVHIEPAKDNAFTFTFADATVYTPSAGKYNFFRTLGSIAATVSGEDWVGSLVDVAANAAEARDLPSNAQTIYTFALRYDEGKLVGLVNIVNKYADPTRQQTTRNSTPAITLVKRDDNFPELLRAIFDDQPEIIEVKTLKDKWRQKLSKEEVYKRLYAFDPQLGQKYQKARTTEKVAKMTTAASIFALMAGVHMIINDPPWERNKITTGAIVTGSSLLSGIASAIVWHNASSSKQRRLINQYNNQIIQQHDNKPVAELRFGITSSGGVGLALTF
jgi:hypothetical protein